MSVAHDYKAYLRQCEATAGWDFFFLLAHNNIIAIASVLCTLGQLSGTGVKGMPAPGFLIVTAIKHWRATVHLPFPLDMSRGKKNKTKKQAIIATSG